MKILILLLLLQLCVQSIICEDSVLSKFHQNSYKIKDYRFEIKSYNKKYFNVFEAKTFKYNRTTPAVNATVNAKVTVRDKLEGLVQGFKFLSNEYRHFPIRFQVNLKKAFDANAGGMGTLKNCGNVSTFSFEKDVTYHICNYCIDESRFPPLIPNGKYKFDVKILYFNDEVAIVSGFGEVYTPVEYPKH